jgi:iron complex outermembrane receptor protein
LQFVRGVDVNAVDGHHDVSVFGRNIFDEEKNIYTIDFNNLTGVVNEPRIWGVEYAWRY